ncbi:MAG: fibronectin type III domain-containing protein, partial [Acidimicrobiia bacterium]|nr:fibronectin type III domain-containing protein [Acidimicrobiia bacterium]
LLTAGQNTLAAEIHQISSSSSDISFDLELRAVPSDGPPPPPDTQAPSVPAGVAVEGTASDSVSLSWSASSDDVAVDRYEIFRDQTMVGQTAATSFTDTGLAPSTSYTYTVEAVDTSENRSGPSDPVTATTDTAPAGPVTLVPAGSVWSYNDTGSIAPDWNQPGYDDSAWDTGPAQLGYGDGDENTRVDRNGLTTWFRHTFTAPTTADSIDLSVLRDDGVVIYLNGTEIWRNNMPTGTITADTRASGHVNGTEESTWVTVTVPASVVSGTNLLAAEIHQSSPNSSDISFDLEAVSR